MPAPTKAPFQPSGNPPGACFRCGLYGHWARDCDRGVPEFGPQPSQAPQPRAVLGRVPRALSFCLWAIGLPIPFPGQQWCAGAAWGAQPARPPLFYMPPWWRSMEAAQLTTCGFSAPDCLMPEQKIQSSPIKPWPLADGHPVQWIHG